MKRFVQLLCLLIAGQGVTGAWAHVRDGAGNEERIELNEAEREWIRRNPVVHFSYDPLWTPFSYRDQRGEFSGIERDILSRMEQRLGLRFEPVHAPSWLEAYEAARGGAADFLVSTARSVERERDFLFTEPYNTFPMAIVARSDSPALSSMEKLRGRRIALAEGYVGTAAIQRDYPDLPRVMVKTMEEAFLAVAAGRADVAVTNIANANHIIRSAGLTNLKIAGVMPYTFDLRYAVRKDQPILRDILDKGVASLSMRERHEIVGAWMTVAYDPIVRWDYVMRWVLGGVLVAGAFIAVVVWHNRRLSAELAERARIQRELEHTKRRLEELNEEKSGLMHMAAHDLRNPLGSLMLHIDILSETAAPKEREALQRMLGLVHQMIHMVRNLLDVQALEDGRRRFVIEPVDIAEAAVEVVSAMEAQASRKRIKLTTEFARSIPPAAVDRAALRQVLNNLISNAVKYSPFDREVTVEAEPGLGGKVVLRVRDQGPGIAQADMPRLFQKYACLGTRPTGGEQATGLGLAIVRQLVAAMHGTVRCESTPGEGATFIVELPAVQEARAGGGPGAVV